MAFLLLLLNMFSSCISSNCKNSLMARKKYLWLVDFLKSPENVVCIVIKMADVAKVSFRPCLHVCKLGQKYCNFPTVE